MRKKKRKPKPKKKSNKDPDNGNAPKHGVLDSLLDSGWIQNTSVTAIGAITAVICLTMRMNFLKTAVVTAGVILTALVWIVAAIIIRTADRNAENPPFSVRLETTFIGDNRDTGQMACLYNNKYISPVSLYMFARIVNLQDTPATISHFKIEVLQQRRKLLPDKWISPTEVSEHMSLVWINPPPTPSRNMELFGGRLLLNIREPIAAHATVWGWILFDPPPEYDSSPRPISLRVTIRDTAGREFSTINPWTTDNIANPPRGWNIQGVADLTGYTLKHLSGY